MASNKVVLPADLQDHARVNLTKFIGKITNFQNEDDQRKAHKNYIDLLGFEKELKSTLVEFKDPPRAPHKNDMVTYEVFKKVTKENVLTKAILKQFVENQSARDAAWDYHTLKISYDSLNALKGVKPENTKEGAVEPTKENRRENRFNKDGKAGTTKEGNNTTTITVGKQPPVGDPGKLQGATSQQQAATEDVDMVEDHRMRAHLHASFAGFPHHEGDPTMEDQDDSTRIILKLLWTHQDYFDQKALSKAQAEYNFYRTIERAWKKALDRVKMEDIKHEKFKMEMFQQLPKERPLYAVIATILEQSKEKKDAVGAAEEYYRMKVLEDTMIEQKMITSIPEGIDLDQAHFSELYKNMKARFKTSGSQAQMRQAAEFKMVPLFEYLKLKETITHQRNQIEELASRLSGIASQQLADGDPGFTDLGDKNRPQKLGEKFAELFDESWASAYESLKPKNPEPDADDDDETDEKTVNVLQQVVKVIYEFCQKVAEEQNTRIVAGMIPPIIDPLNFARKSEVKIAVEQAAEYVKTKTDQLAKQYRKVVAPTTIKVLNKEILENELKGKLLLEPVSKDVEAYVRQCIDLVWYMCIQQPPMEIMWAKPGEKFNREVFRFSGKKGKKFKMTVWPAVFLHKDGPLVAPGYAVPE